MAEVLTGRASTDNYWLKSEEKAVNILFTICGRAGSKGILNKNIRDFAGKPLPFYSLSAIDLYLKKHEEVQYDIVVNSDSEILLDMMKNSGIRPVDLIDRNASLAGDTIGKIDVIANCLDVMQERGLIDLYSEAEQLRITLRQVDQKVDLEESVILRDLRSQLKE